MACTPHLSKLLLIIITLFGTLYLNSAIAADDYLDALEAEAHADDEKTEASTTSTTSSEPSMAIKSAVDKEHELVESKRIEFEIRLKNELPTTFRTYGMISEENKHIVIDSYFDNNRSMPTATRILFDLYFKK